ncbi:CZB domain-containing protein [Undibacterium sp. SXout11W]|uniref:CZB domain-containing protein n=1 Tax=Undibacterium sp. SXout11W TaxID=3413050 RepID=UPI003BEF6F3A
MDLSNAIAKHSEWKTKLRSAVAKQETLDAATISKDHCCDLGKWLHWEAKANFGNMTSYTECIKKHAAFHVEAGKVATSINAKKCAEAEAMLAGGTPYASASSAIGVAILHLKKDAGV